MDDKGCIGNTLPCSFRNTKAVVETLRSSGHIATTLSSSCSRWMFPREASRTIACIVSPTDCEPFPTSLCYGYLAVNKMEDLPYDPSRCLTFWFRLVQSHHLQRPFSAGVRVERVDSSPRRDGGTLTFPQEMMWPAMPIKEGDNIFQVKAAVPVPINSHDQVLFVTLRDVLHRVVARVHVTYDEARTLRHVGFTEWYPAEPAPLRNTKRTKTICSNR